MICYRRIQLHNRTIALDKAPETFKSSVICIGLLLATEYKKIHMCASHFPTFRKEGKPAVYRSMCASHAPPPKTQAVTRCHRKLTYLHYSFELVYKSYLTTDNMEPQLQKGTGTRYFTPSHPTFSHPG